MKRVTVFLFVIVTLLTVGNVNAQSITLDAVSGGVSNDTIFVNQQVQFNLRLNTEGSEYNGITNGFEVSSPDGAEWTTMVGDTFSLGWDTRLDLFIISSFSVTGFGADTVGFGGAVIFSGSGVESTFNEVSYSITIGPVDPIHHRSHICLDSAYYPPSGTWKWQPRGLPAEYPSWDGPHCYIVVDPSAPADPSNIVLSTSFLDFTAVEGGDAPAPQSFDVMSDLDPLSFSLNESSSWIVLSPLQGTTDQSILTSINPIGLTAGTYTDSIEVVAPDADNSPQWVVVTLLVEPPPPTIGVDQTSLIFNAVAGEANPADKILSIFNSRSGSSDLEWSVSNAESWLSLSPTSGTNSGDVTVSVDITGLAFGEYSDTIIVSDPNATNDPVKVPVNLSVGSDLPLIAVESDFNFIIIPGGSATVPARDIIIYNDGAGGMSYSLTEASPRILTLNPISGVATDTVTVGFKINSGNAGDDFFDTLWVHSPEAINSPYPVVFQFHFVNIPAEIVMFDTVEVDVYECDQGATRTPPQGYFAVNNVPTAESYYPEFEYESELFYLEFENNSIPEFVSVVAYDLQLPIGSYYDTITVSAIEAINSPQQIIVKYNVIPGDDTPLIAGGNKSYSLPIRANTGPDNTFVLEVLNFYGGCMEWSIQEDIPWLEPSKISGNVPETSNLIVNADGFSLGSVKDTFYLEAPLAGNSPKAYTIEMKVWTLAGDMDWNGYIDITDLILMVDYFFLDGPSGQPTWLVGDLDCDYIVDVSDLVYMVDYMFDFGPSPCGNPF